MPRRSLEHFPAVPFEKAPSRPPLRPLWLPHALAMVTQQRLHEARRAVGLIGDEQHAILAEREAPQVEGESDGCLTCATTTLTLLAGVGEPLFGAQVAKSREAHDTERSTRPH